MDETFAEKFEEALNERKQREPGYGLRTLARTLAKDDPHQIEVIRRRLNKYRPKPGGGAAEVKPTDPTRHEIEEAMGLERDSLKAVLDERAAARSEQEFLAALSPLRRLWELAERFDRGELVLAPETQRAGRTNLAVSAAGSQQNGG